MTDSATQGVPPPPIDGLSWADVEKFAGRARVIATLDKRYGQSKWGQPELLLHLGRELAKYTRMKGVRSSLDRRHGAFLWGNSQVVAYMLEQDSLKDSGVIPENPGKRTPKVVVTGAGVEARLVAYRAQLADSKLNDQATLHRLCVIEVELEAIDKRRQENVDVDDYKKLSELYLKYSAEHRALQDALGITRAKRQEEIDAAETFKSFINRGRLFLAQNTLRIECPHCKDSRKFNLGFIAFHFDGKVPWRFQAQCPNPDCRKPFTLKGELFQDSQLLSETDFLAPDEQLDKLTRIPDNQSDIGSDAREEPRPHPLQNGQDDE